MTAATLLRTTATDQSPRQDTAALSSDGLEEWCKQNEIRASSEEDEQTSSRTEAQLCSQKDRNLYKNKDNYTLLWLRLQQKANEVTSASAEMMLNLDF